MFEVVSGGYMLLRLYVNMSVSVENNLVCSIVSVSAYIYALELFEYSSHLASLHTWCEPLNAHKRACYHSFLCLDV